MISRAMIAGAVSERTDDHYRLLIRPNQSLSVPTMCWLLGSCGVVMMAIGIYFAFKGLWPVLPIAGLEFGALVLAFMVVTRRAKDFDMVVIGAQTVRVHQSVNGREHEYSFLRPWVRVQMTREHRPGRWHPSRLLLGSHGKFVEIGRTMTEPARRALELELRRSLQG